MRNGKKKSVVGDPINFRGMAHAPTNEAGVVALFSMVARDLGMLHPGNRHRLPRLHRAARQRPGLGRTGRRI